MVTETVSIFDLNSESSQRALERAAEIIRSGGLVVFPTETVYGLGADATNGESARRIYEAKGRPSDNPLIIHIAEPADAETYTYTSELYYKLAERFMPGPLTVIMRARDTVAKETRAGLETVAVRCPTNRIAHALIERSGVAIAAPSANISGSPSPTCSEHVIQDMNGRVDMIIASESSDIGVESTIVKLEEDNTLTLLRPGAVTLEQLSEISDVRVADAVLESLKEGETPLSPGMKYRHYAPSAPTYLLDGDAAARAKYVTARGKNVAVLCYSDESALYENVRADLIFTVGEEGDAKEFARVLFYALREADRRGAEEIYAPLPEKSGVGLALYNRMIRAAAHQIIKV